LAGDLVLIAALPNISKTVHALAACFGCGLTANSESAMTHTEQLIAYQQLTISSHTRSVGLPCSLYEMLLPGCSQPDLDNGLRTDVYLYYDTLLRGAIAELSVVDKRHHLMCHDLLTPFIDGGNSCCSSCWSRPL